MASERTEITELATALGVLPGEPADVLSQPRPPAALTNVDNGTWSRLRSAWHDGRHLGDFLAAHANGRALASARDGLRGRAPVIVEWKGPHRPPGDDTIPADLRIDHVYLVSCKYLSKVLLNPGPPRLFDRLLVGDERSGGNWFALTAPREFQAFYDAVVNHAMLKGLPTSAVELSRTDQAVLKQALPDRLLPRELLPYWAALSNRVAEESAARWAAALASPRDQLRMLWRLLRIASVTYFVLGTQPASGRRSPAVLRVRVDATWDWSQSFELRSFAVSARPAGQPEVAWEVVVGGRATNTDRRVAGHVEVRWSHGRFSGSPEAKVYLDTPLLEVPGYRALI
jgi:hypothetical protein